MKKLLIKRLNSLEKRVAKKGVGDYLFRIENEMHKQILQQNLSYSETVCLKKMVSDKIDKLTKNISVNTF